MQHHRKCAPLFFLLLFVSRLSADVINFDSLSDGDLVTSQFSGLTFSNGVALTAGLSLNEFELPPRSDFNVISDDGGPITIDFLLPIQSFGGYFTYLSPLTLTGFDAANTQVALATSTFANNFALSGDVGSNPNEFLSFVFVGGISRVSIAGDPAGFSFALDDLTYETKASDNVVPEPRSVLLLLGAAIAIAVGGGSRLINRQNAHGRG